MGNSIFSEPVEIQGQARRRPVAPVSVDVQSQRSLDRILGHAPPGYASADVWRESQRFDGTTFLAIKTFCRALQSATAEVMMPRPKGNKPGKFRKAMASPHALGPDEKYVPVSRQTHPDLVNLFRSPNPSDTFAKFLARCVIQNCLHGRILIWMVPKCLWEDGGRTVPGPPVRMYVLPAALCQAQSPSGEHPHGAWRVSQVSQGMYGGYGTLGYGTGTAVIDKRCVLDIQEPHNLWHNQPYSPQQGARTQLDLIERIDRSAWALMENAVDPSGVLDVPGVDEAQIAGIQAQLAEKHAGSDNRKKVLIVSSNGAGGGGGSGMKFTPNASAVEIGMAEAHERYTAFSLAVFGLDMTTVGLKPSGSSYSETFARFKAVWMGTYQPFLHMLGQELTRGPVKLWGLEKKDWRVQIDTPKIDDPTLLEEQLKADVNIRTVNQRLAVRNLPPVEGGDVPEPIYLKWLEAKVMPQPQPGAGMGGGQPPPGGAVAAPAGDEDGKPSLTDFLKPGGGDAAAQADAPKSDGKPPMTTPGAAAIGGGDVGGRPGNAGGKGSLPGRMVKGLEASPPAPSPAHALAADIAARVLAELGCSDGPTSQDAASLLTVRKAAHDVHAEPRDAHGRWTHGGGSSVANPVVTVPKRLSRHGDRVVALAVRVARRAHEIATDLTYRAYAAGITPNAVLDDAEELALIWSHRSNWLTDHTGVAANAAAKVGSHLVAWAFERVRKAMKAHRKPSPSPAVTKSVGDIYAGVLSTLARRNGVLKSFDESKHPRGKPENAGEFAPKGGGGGKAKDKSAKKAPAKEPDEDEPEWDGEIDQDAVDAGDDIRRIRQWSSWDSDNEETEHDVVLVGGTFTTPQGDDVDVFRWESRDPDGDVEEAGEWTDDRQQALSDGVDHARSQHEETPEPDDSDIPSRPDGQPWGDREVLDAYTTADGDERSVRLEEGSFEFAGQTHACYRWTTRRDDDGDWTLDRRQARRDGEEYARDNHHEPDEDEDSDDEDADSSDFDPDEIDAPPPSKRDVKLGGVKFPKSQAGVSVASSVDEAKADAMVAKIFGTDAGDGWDEISTVLGMPDDASLTVVYVGRYKGLFSGEPPIDGAGVRVEVKHPKLDRVSRFIGIDADGKRFVKNEILEVKKAHQKDGLGADIFAKQVESASEAGFDYVATHAAGDSRPGSMNGYYTWPRFGYDQSLTDPVGIHSTDKAAYAAARERFPEAKTVLDIMATSEGREWWKQNGTDLMNARFDLEPGSRSMGVLADYLAERRAKSPGAGTAST